MLRLHKSRYDGLFDQTHYRLSMSLLSSPHLLFRRKRKNSCQCDRSEGGSGHQIPIDQAIHGSASINELKSLIMGFFATLYNNVPAAFPISGPRKGMGMKRLPSSVDIALTAADAQASAIQIAHSFPVHSPLM